jgi:hypothetical protein
VSAAITHRIVLCFVIGGCMTSCASKPILYPNQHYQQVGRDVADREIEDCSRLAKDAGASTGQSKTRGVAGTTVGGGAVGSAAGAVGGAIAGHPGRGAMVGAASGATAGFLRGLFRRSPPDQAYKQIVQRCLQERGFDPVGWE